MDLPENGGPGPDKIICGVCGLRFKFFTVEQGQLAMAHILAHTPVESLAALKRLKDEALEKLVRQPVVTAC